ncbi:hypothetical protein [Mycobacterium avium]|uniref:hypothetical protein n=1 Tax=Mycobacterium avium TaxID=1764 RepID=UPI0007A0CB53|nr:hypothetical protein [Mycobacterium avium]
MPDDFENDPHFIDVEGDLGGEGMGVLSRDALNLHLHGCLNSISDGHPGFVSDEYLDAISAETTIPAAELEAAGVWERREGGYFVVADDVLKIAIDYNEESARKEAECADRGRHLPHEPDGSAWIICEHCGTPVERPDGGPVALPNGGPLGPDMRDR